MCLGLAMAYHSCGVSTRCRSVRNKVMMEYKALYEGVPGVKYSDIIKGKLLLAEFIRNYQSRDKSEIITLYKQI